MINYIIKRILLFIPVFAGMAILSFILVRSAPGSPFSSEKNISDAAMRSLNKEYGFDRPMYVQLGMYFENLSKGYLGKSLYYKNITVNQIIAQSLPTSARLGILAVTISLIIGIPLGIISAFYKNSTMDYLSMLIAVIGISIPPFVTASVLVLIFGFYFKILPAVGWFGPKYMILPAITLAAPYIAYVSRLMRTSMIDTLDQDYMKTAVSKGMPDYRLIFIHALKNSIIPVISFIGPASAGILTGSIVVEKIFAIPGMGINFIHSALHRDYFLAIGCALVYGILLMIFNLVSDILYTFFDPRISYESNKKV